MFGVQKKRFFLALCTIVFIVSGCSRIPQISKSVSSDNFSKYAKNIREISNKYHISMNEIKNTDLYDENDINKGFNLSRVDMLINVFFQNDALENEQEGEETFLIAYMIPTNKDYDLGLFVELVNAVSGRTISSEYCEEFLNDLDVSDKDSREKKEAFSESKPLNWESNWVISYSLSDTEFPNMFSQKLKFTGFTKAMP